MKRFLLLLTCITSSRASKCEKPEAIDLSCFVSVSQSSTPQQDPRSGPERAIDGVKESVGLNEIPCAQTRLEKEPWWSLDLKEAHAIHSVVISNKWKSRRERLEGAEIRIGNSNKRKNPVCNTITDMSSDDIFIPCYGMTGRYLDVVLTQKTERLQLCEVEVYGKLLDVDCVSSW